MTRFPLALAGMAVFGSSFAVVESNFDVDADGWMSAAINTATLEVYGTAAPTWSAGTIGVTEFGPTGSLIVFAAPAKFVGDKSSYYGGTFSFDLASATNDGIPYPNLLLHGNGLTLFATTMPPSTSLTHYSFAIEPTSFTNGLFQTPTEAELQGVLANLLYVGINADWTTSTIDVGTLDNVVMSEPVPEPATLTVLGLGALALLRRRKSRN